MKDSDSLHRRLSQPQIPDKNLGPASRDELQRLITISPQEIAAQEDFQPGLVAKLDTKLLSPDDIVALVEPTKRKDFEVGFSFDAETDTFYYFIGDSHTPRVTSEQMRVGHKILRTTLVDVHTHPSYSWLLPSSGDIDNYTWMDFQSRHWIGMHGDLKDNGFTGLMFREFSKYGDRINGLVNANQLSEEINGMLQRN